MCHLPFKHRQNSNWPSTNSIPLTSDKPGFWLDWGRLHAFAPRWAFDRTEPETAQPGVWKRHVGPQPAHHYLLTASHIHSAKGIQELQSSTKPRFIQSWRLESMWVCCKSAPVSMCGDRKRCWKTLLRLGAVCGCVFVSWVELQLECREEWHITSFTPVPSHDTLRWHALPARLMAINFFSASNKNVRMFESKKTLCLNITMTPLVLVWSNGHQWWSLEPHEWKLTSLNVHLHVFFRRFIGLLVKDTQLEPINQGFFVEKTLLCCAAAVWLKN